MSFELKFTAGVVKTEPITGGRNQTQMRMAGRVVKGHQKVIGSACALCLLTTASLASIPGSPHLEKYGFTPVSASRLLVSSDETRETSDTHQPEVPENDDHWIDTGHRSVVEKADNIAEWMNQFFGDVRSEETASYSTLRLRVEQEYDEENQFDSDLKLRGKVYLPQLNERLSLLFSDEDTGDTGRDDLLIDQRDTTEDVTLQYNAAEKERYRIDFRAGLRSSLNIKTSARYLYEYPLSESLIGTFSEEVLYLGGDGFASKTRLELDKLVGDDKLLQWHNKTEWQENLPGVYHDSSLSLDHRLSDKRAFGYFVGLNARTKPDALVNNYYLGVRYRQQVFRPWLFFEVQPSYRWSKSDREVPRENAAVILFRLEAVFQRDLGE